MARVTGVVDEEEYQEQRVCRGERDAGYDVDGFGNPYRVRWHLTLAAVAPDVWLLFLPTHTHTYICYLWNFVGFCFWFLSRKKHLKKQRV